jgi:hypothetical protein
LRRSQRLIARAVRAAKARAALADPNLVMVSVIPNVNGTCSASGTT